MRRVFADTDSWVDRINSLDQWHAVDKTLTGLRQVNTDEVLDEVLWPTSAATTLPCGPWRHRSYARAWPTQRSRSCPGHGKLSWTASRCTKPASTRVTA